MTTAELTTLKAYIDADPVLSAKPMNGDGYYDIAQILNQTATPAFYVWNSRAPVSDVFDTIIWANMTPHAPASADATGIYRDRALTCQGKQFNLQTILMGRTEIDATKANIRSGLQDALTALPSKADGTNQSAGWSNVQLKLQRLATTFEKIFATGTGSTASPALTTLTLVSPEDVNMARNLA